MVTTDRLAQDAITGNVLLTSGTVSAPIFIGNLRFVYASGLPISRTVVRNTVFSVAGINQVTSTLNYGASGRGQFDIESDDVDLIAPFLFLSNTSSSSDYTFANGAKLRVNVLPNNVGPIGTGADTLAVPVQATFLYTMTAPEPGTFALLSLGIIGLIARRKKK